jgi:hypothetical protein
LALGWTIEQLVILAAPRRGHVPVLLLLAGPVMGPEGGEAALLYVQLGLPRSATLRRRVAQPGRAAGAAGGAGLLLKGFGVWGGVLGARSVPLLARAVCRCWSGLSRRAAPRRLRLLSESSAAERR